MFLLLILLDKQVIVIETDEERTYFLIGIPFHPAFVTETLPVEQIGVKGESVQVFDGCKKLN